MIMKMSDVVEVLTRCENFVTRGNNDLDTYAGGIVQVIEAAWTYAGSPPQVVKLRGDEVRQRIAAVREHVAAVATDFRALRRMVREAVAAVEHVEAERKRQSAKLKV